METLQKEKLTGELLPMVAPELHLPEVMQVEELADKLTWLGLKTAGKTVERISKMRAAYAQYTYLPPDKVDTFNQKLYEETLREDKAARDFKKLIFTPIDQWDKIPPRHVLRELEIAQKRDIFDYYEVAHIRWIHEVKDPIIFGRIDGCNDRFFIAQWDDDISIEELLAIK